MTMENQNSGTTAKPENFISYLRGLQAREISADIRVKSGGRSGIVHVRDGNVVSASTETLHGNGAILSLAVISEPELEVTDNNSPVQKSVSLSLAQIHKIISGQKPVSTKLTEKQEKQLLDEAKMLFFQFHHKLASQKLISILRSNRFYYPAWLWQSRVITRQDYIGKALDEAYRWGNHDQEIWREARKIRPQIDGSESTVKRCFFCWSLLEQPGQCSHCHSYLVITSQPQSTLLKTEDLKYCLSFMEQAIKLETTNARLAYSIAIGYFNLKQYRQALKFMHLARKLSPKISLYAKSLTLLTTIAKTQPDKSSVVTKLTPEPSGTGNKVLLIEDSQTSRKVLSMLFQRKGYEVLEAENGEKALQTAITSRPDLIILDVMLPDTTGHELLPQLRDIPHISKIPVIMLTGKQTAKDKLLGLSAGVNEYVTKPFNPEKLTRLIASYLPGVTPETKRQSEPARTTPATPHVSSPAPEPRAVEKTKPASLEKVSAPVATKEEHDLDPNQKTIFVVEDSPTSRKVLKMILKRSQFNVIEAATGKEALATAEKIKPNLVLLDVMLPDMTGYDILPVLKKMPDYLTTPVFILTGKKAPSDKMKGMLLGSDEYITKPFNPEKLLTLINSYI